MDRTGAPVDDERQRLREWFEAEQRRPRQSIIQALDSLGLEDGDRVADIGCGPGVHLRHILERVAPRGQVVGIDTSADRLAVAESMLDDEIARGSIQLVKGDLHALDSDLGPFDLIWMSLVLHHENIPVEVIENLSDIVTPGGKIAILEGDDLASCPFLPWPPQLEMSVRQAIARAAEDSESSRWFSRRYTARNLTGIMADAGLKNVEVRAYSDIRQAPLDDWDLQDIEDWMINSFGARMRDYLPPADWHEIKALFSAESSTSLLRQPDFFFIRTWFLGVGTLH